MAMVRPRPFPPTTQSCSGDARTTAELNVRVGNRQVQRIGVQEFERRRIPQGRHVA
jgi:hypothetical protein